MKSIEISGPSMAVSWKGFGISALTSEDAVRNISNLFRWLLSGASVLSPRIDMVAIFAVNLHTIRMS